VVLVVAQVNVVVVGPSSVVDASPESKCDERMPTPVPKRDRGREGKCQSGCGSGRATAYGRAALRRELDELGQAVQGTRNDSLNRAAFALGQLVASGALEEGSTADALLDAGLRLGLGERECERTIASGMGAGMDTPRSLTR
jgi:hypothetical protein